MGSRAGEGSRRGPGERRRVRSSSDADPECNEMPLAHVHLSGLRFNGITRLLCEEETVKQRGVRRLLQWFTSWLGPSKVVELESLRSGLGDPMQAGEGPSGQWTC